MAWPSFPGCWATPHSFGQGAPDLSKADATLLIGANAGTALEIVEVAFTDIQGVSIAPSKGNSVPQRRPRNRAV